ncbi:hypothetical protein GCM10008967_32280 [Bacillus carboniphilus]|uniref:Uncharacterized protein n=1 Tax=Bacillus carboniphilus TaxID=86663 RepID=A0ABP3G8L9_9BACI
MKMSFVPKFKKFLAFFLITIIVISVSYLFVFKVSFLPLGYDSVDVQKDRISLQSYNVVGMEKDITTVTFSEKDTWKIGEIEKAIKRLKEFLWLLYFAITISLFFFFYKIRNGIKLWKATLESNIIFAFLIPLPAVISSVNQIQDLIS